MKCEICPLECDLGDGEHGKCNVRVGTHDGIQLANYGMVTTAIAGPIEQKPFFHFNPGMRVLSIGGSGCNLFCKFCQNFEISQVGPRGDTMSPQDIVRMAWEQGCGAIVFTYAEPVVMYEFVMDVAYAARRAGLFVAMKTNGFANPKPFDDLCRLMDAVNVDVKGTPADYDETCGVKMSVEALLESIKIAHRHSHLEMSFLPIPTEGGSEDATLGRMLKSICSATNGIAPVHVLRFVPDFKMRTARPASLDFVEKMAAMARDVGFRYVYQGYPGAANVTGCHTCGTELVVREGVRIVSNALVKGEFCPRCGCGNSFSTNAGIIHTCATTTSAATPCVAGSSR